MPEVSIITPCYNSSKYLAETIQSVINQNFTDWEWIITDDGSQDNSVEIIQQHNDPRIILITSKKNSGADMPEIWHYKRLRADTSLSLMPTIFGRKISSVRWSDL